MEKMYTWEALKGILDRRREAGDRIAFTNGCFDILHVGHVRYLQEARRAGDCLVVAVNSDASVRTLKGERRPIVPEAERAEVIAALACVDYVTLFGEETPLKVIEYLRPQVLVKGADWQEEQVVGREAVLSWGGKVLLCPLTRGASTTNAIARILDVYGKVTPSP